MRGGFCRVAASSNPRDEEKGTQSQSGILGNAKIAANQHAKNQGRHEVVHVEPVSDLHLRVMEPPRPNANRNHCDEWKHNFNDVPEENHAVCFRCRSQRLLQFFPCQYEVM